MTYQEYLKRQAALKKQLELLDKVFIDDNEYNKFVGKKVILQGIKGPVIYEGLISNGFWGLEKAYRKLKKDGSPYACTNTTHISSRIIKILD